MTIVVSLLFPTHVVQVSDRMLTFQVGSKTVRQEDKWNKATVFGDRAAIAYTGAARVPDQRTDQWITETLMNVTDVGQAMALLAAAADDRLKRGQIRPPGLTVVFAGWSEQLGQMWPAVGLVTNILTPAGASTAPRPKFDMFSYESHVGGQLGIHVAGQPMPINAKNALARSVKNAVAKGTSMAAVARLTAMKITEMRNPYVGQSFLAVVLPRPVAGRPASTLVGAVQTGPHPDSPCSYFFPAPGADPLYVMPNITGGGVAITDISVIPRALTPEEVKAHFRAGPPKPK